MGKLNVFVCLHTYCFDQKCSHFLRPPLTNLRVIKWTNEKSAAIELEKSRGQLLMANYSPRGMVEGPRTYITNKELLK